MKHNLLLFISLLLLATIPFGCVPDPKKDDPITVPKDAVLTLTTSEITFKGKEIRNEMISFTTNKDWTVTTSDSKDPVSWLDVRPISGIAGDRSITIVLRQENTNPTPRKAYIQIKAGDLIKTVIVNQKAGAKIDVDVSDLKLTNIDPQEFTFTTNYNWKINSSEDPWFTVSSSSGIAGTHTIKVTPTVLNTTSTNMEGYIEIEAGENEAAHRISLFLKPMDKTVFYADKEVKQLFSATQGKGIDLVIMGEGFTAKDLVRSETGKYETAMKQAAEHYFSIEPYRTYRDFFNVYMVIAQSPEEGVHKPLRDVRNRFNTKYGEGTAVNCDYNLCMEYALCIESIKGKTVDIGDLSTILVLNSKRYAGTCWMRYDGHSIAMCPMSEYPAPYDFEGVIHHEAGGHGFAKLADEYINYAGKTIPAADVESGKWWHSIGFYSNIDFTNDLSRIIWKDFINVPKYSDVGAYQGGYYYALGVWRPESNSCMNNNVPYYNAPSRWAIVKRIMDLAGQPFTFNDFMQRDVIDTKSRALPHTKASVRTMPPLAPPIVVR